jgi:hypothetical protein
MVQARIPEALRVTSSLPEKSGTGVCNFITGPGDMYEQSIRNKVSGGLIVGFDVTNYLMPHRLSRPCNGRRKICRGQIYMARNFSIGSLEGTNAIRLSSCYLHYP